MIRAPISEESLTLYGSFTSSSSYKPMLYLALAGLPFSFRTVNLKIGVQSTPEYLAINRWGVVPSLRHRGLTILQSNVILDYLARTTGHFEGRDQQGFRVEMRFRFLAAAVLSRLRCGIAQPFPPHRELPLVIVPRSAPAAFFFRVRCGGALALGFVTLELLFSAPFCFCLHSFGPSLIAPPHADCRSVAHPYRSV
jgi:hypothetical protein